MGEQTEDAEEVTVEKRRFVVVTHRRHKYRCRCNGAVKTAPGPLRLIPGGRYSLDFAIALELDKRLGHQPLDRQRRQMEREGLVLSTQTMWDQEEALASLLEPSYLALLQYILGADVIGADETHWRLMQPGASKKWWAWCLTTHDAAWYMIEPSRSADTIAGVLGDFEGVVMCDGYAGYGTLARRSDGRLRLAHCWAHVRRKFHESRESSPRLAGWILRQLQHLYAIEARLRENKTGPALRLAVRAHQSRPVVDRLERVFLRLKASGKHLPQIRSRAPPPSSTSNPSAVGGPVSSTCTKAGADLSFARWCRQPQKVV